MKELINNKLLFISPKYKKNNKYAKLKERTDEHMSKFNESTLENAIMELFEQNVGYTHVYGGLIHKEKSEVLLKKDLIEHLLFSYINEGITKQEAEYIVKKVEDIAKLPLYEANREFTHLITDGADLTRLDSNKKDFHYYLIDFNNIESNNFKIINQLEIKGNEIRIPDAIVYINGLPIVVFEFKSAVKENTTIKNAYDQLTIRYKRSIPDLFKYNAFIVISDGVNNKYGSFFADYEYFYSWRIIEKDDEELDGIDSLYTMINGLFRKDRILDVIHNFIYIPDKSSNELKIVCRYPQYFATKALFENVKKELKPLGSGKGGTYFGATGCGKSMTMLFLTRLLMKDIDLSSPTVVLITDRTDLDDQLTKLFINAKSFIGDNSIISVESREHLKNELGKRESGGVFLTTIQKFSENTDLLSLRNNIICISDEAHRSQVNINGKTKRTNTEIKKTFGFAKYLHDSLPNATYVGFTGTPIDSTLEVFGKVVEAYTMSESVKDGITVNIVYEGRSAKVSLDDDKVKLIEKYYQECAEDGASEYQIEESQKAVSSLEVIIGDENRLQALAEDLIKHYENRVNEKATIAGKAMIVCMNRQIAYRLYKKIIELRPEWGIKKEALNLELLSEKEKKELIHIPLINLVMTRDKDDPNDMYQILKEYDKDELDRQFKNINSNFKIAIVVDMWLTGFDCPSLDTMYIDKPLQEHTLIQTISRVNRVYPGKDKGLVVDYFGIKTQMNFALKKYNKKDMDIFEGIDASIKIVKDELEILNLIFRNFNMNDYLFGTPNQKLICLNKAVEYVQITEDLEKRFMANVKRMKSAFNLCSLSEQFSEQDRDLIYFYCAIRSIIFKYTKGDAPDLTQMNDKVRKMIQEAIKSDGIEELFVQNSSVRTRTEDIFSDEYLEKINRIPYINTKIKILSKLAKDAIEEYKKVNKIKGIEFGDRLQKLVDSYNDRQEEKIYAEQVLDNVAEELEKLLKDLSNDKNSFEKLGIDFEEKAFLDILEAIAKKYEFYNKYIEDHGAQYLIDLAKEIKRIVDDKSKYTDWSKKEDIKAELKVDIILKLAEFKYPPVTQDEVYKEIFEQAENFKKNNK